MRLRAGVSGFGLAVLAALFLALPVRPAAAAPSFAHRVDAVRDAAAQADLALALFRYHASFWRTWAAVDGQVEAAFRARFPEASERLQFQDPEVSLNAVAWLLDELAGNAEMLAAAGRGADAERMLVMGENVAASATLRNDPFDLLLANTMARLLLAGWRDSPDPLGAMESQVQQVLTNVQGVRDAVQPVANARVPKGLPARLAGRVVRAFLAGRAANVVPALVLARWLGLYGAARLLFPLDNARPPVLAAAAAGRHAAAADEVACAMNLPFGLVPAAPALERFLAAAGAGLPGGDALLLGAGDGSEARRVARLPQLLTVASVDHAAMSTERVLTLVRRLGGTGGLSRVQAVLQDVNDFVWEPGAASLVVASHLVEYLTAEERVGLYRKARDWLRPGGMMFVSLHLAEGERFDALRQGFVNVSAQATEDRVRITITDLVPSQPQAEQVQSFLTRSGLQEELAAAGLDAAGGFRVTVEISPAATGFVEAVIVATKVK